MIPYKIAFILDEKTDEAIHFESNEKPFKSELYTIQDSDGKLWEAKITEVVKMIIRSKNSEVNILYRCKIEKNQPTTNVIGFGKRN